MAMPKIGIISEDSVQRHRLQRALNESGVEVACNLSPDRVDENWILSRLVQIWLIDLGQEEQYEDLFSDMLDRSPAPILFYDPETPHENGEYDKRWVKRLVDKIQKQANEAEPESTESVGSPELPWDNRVNMDASALSQQQPPELTNKITLPSDLPPRCKRVADHVWILGASLGGPEAVSRFLASLPKSLPVSFVLAQHIGKEFQDTLCEVLAQHAPLRTFVAKERCVVHTGELLLAPIDNTLTFLPGPVVELENESWAGPYAPSVDQVMIRAAKGLSTVDTGAIIFSGMGDDGAEGAVAMAARGFPVWAQSEETCANSSMPDAARDSGVVTFNGSPEQLAEKLTEHVLSEQQSLEESIDG
ncbi:chemotaxis protein CheB [Pelagibaculum spongiae]|uniref:protein-glutamate methylesterase n=1 Tax=Pelagibaculum spongiae TaxID=2080658 RepID=A0A2V1H2G1_9GAMM|nr:chemotaxis protein CheB [Pelagibaculum spongiae]PVZ72160.1 hypothetical protein DC094_03865 [Pelagibaculum spongiae]